MTGFTPLPIVSAPEAKTLYGEIDERRLNDTVVLTHGWDKKGATDFWTGTGERQAGSLIERSMGKSVNILRYNWPGALTSTRIPDAAEYVEARQNVYDAGIRLANQLIEHLGKGYSGKIHFIGHSLGSIVNTYAAATFLNQMPYVKDVQFTALDRPNHVDKLPFHDGFCPMGMSSQACDDFFVDHYGFDRNFFATILPVTRAGLIIDNYYSLTGLTGVGDIANGPVYNHPPLVDPWSLGAGMESVFNEAFANDHSGVQQWYRWTISPYDPLPPKDGQRKVCEGASFSSDYANRARYNASLNPCDKGWDWSILKSSGPPVNQMITPGPTTSGIFPAANPSAIDPSGKPCNTQVLNGIISIIKCTEGSSPYSAIPVTIPQGSATLSFTYNFANRGDGDYAAVVLDNTPIWVLSGSSATPGVDQNSGPIPIGGLTGNRILTVALYGVGGNNFIFELKNFAVQTAPTSGPALSIAMTHTGNFAQGQQNARHSVIVSNATGAAATSGTVTVTETVPSGLALVSMAGAGWACSANTCSRNDAIAGGSSYPAITVTVNVAANATSPQLNVVTLTGGGSASNSTADSVIVTASGGGGGGSGTPLTGNLRFVPVAPCRVVDTRGATGQVGAFGPPIMAGGGSRTFPVSSSPCGIPPSALSYSLNVTVVPSGPLAYLTTWPTGQQRPLVSTLNSFEGRVVANAAIVPAGANGSIDVFVTNPTHVIIDINGYFDGQNSAALSFYPATPCRIADTRNAAGPFGGPSINGQTKRDFPISSSACSMPSAGAYSLNATVVPPAALGYLTLWPTGQTQPFVSTLNSFDGAIVANAAIVPAGANGSISAFVSNTSDVILDGNGYFAASGSPGALSFYPVQPCRVADTRSDSGKTGAFGAPSVNSGQTRDFPIPSSTCGIPAGAKAYSINVTVVPKGPLSYLTLWPTGQNQPFVSTLNSFQGRIVANAAIVPAGTNGSVSVFVTNPTDVIIDINGYFAP
ncbi:MAG: hypothetical protein ACKV22_31280 [Bryobacteraceae bacterium]